MDTAFLLFAHFSHSSSLLPHLLTPPTPPHSSSLLPLLPTPPHSLPTSHRPCITIAHHHRSNSCYRHMAAPLPPLFLLILPLLLVHLSSPPFSPVAPAPALLPGDGDGGGGGGGGEHRAPLLTSRHWPPCRESWSARELPGCTTVLTGRLSSPPLLSSPSPPPLSFSSLPSIFPLYSPSPIHLQPIFTFIPFCSRIMIKKALRTTRSYFCHTFLHLTL